MPWQERNPAPSDPINRLEGLIHLHGDILAAEYRQPHLAGKSYPALTFPSGAIHEVHNPDNHFARMHLFGSVEIPVATSLEFAAAQLRTAQAENPALRIEIPNTTSLLVGDRHTGRGYRLKYAGNRLADVISYPDYAMALLPGDLRAVLPPIRSTDGQGWQAVAPLKLFTPDANWTWYPTEFDGDDLLFGLVVGFEAELGYFSLRELELVRGPLGLPLERDLYYSPVDLETIQHNIA